MCKCTKCGKEFVRSSNLVMHETYCKKIKKNERLPVDNVQIANNDKENIYNNECIHQYRYLNNHIKNERLAIKNGYEVVCIKCYDLS